MSFLLSCLPVTDALLQGCLKAGFRYYEDFFDASGEWLDEASQLLGLYGWSKEKIEALLKAPSSSSGSDLLKEENRSISIATFCEAIDEVLGGGVYLGSVLQVVGSPGSGKTQFLLQLCVDVQLPMSLGGVLKEAVFIDSECAFSTSRLKEMCSGAYDHCMEVAKGCGIQKDVKDLSVEGLVSGVHYMSIACSSVDLAASLVLLEDFISSNSKVGLVVIDSLAVCFLSVNKTIDRTRMIACTIDTLRRIARRYQVAVVVANDLTTRISTKGEKYLVPALGETLSHLMPTTLLLGPPSWPASHFTAVMYKSSSRPRYTAKFQVVKAGIRDVTSV